MAERPPTQETEVPGRYPGTPGWVKVLGVMAVVGALLIAFALVTGLGGQHGPQRHGASAVVAALGVLATGQ